MAARRHGPGGYRPVTAAGSPSPPARLLHELRPDRIHVLIRGRIVASGGPELSAELESTGYAAYGVTDDPAPAAVAMDPFADPLA